VSFNLILLLLKVTIIMVEQSMLIVRVDSYVLFARLV